MASYQVCFQGHHRPVPGIRLRATRTAFFQCAAGFHRLNLDFLFLSENPCQAKHLLIQLLCRLSLLTHPSQ